MKHIRILVLFISSLIFIASCATKSQKTEDKQEFQIEAKNPLHEEKFNYTLTVNHSFLTEKNVGETISVSGKLLNNGNSFTLIENPDSRSRVSFILEVTDAETKKTLQEFVGKTVTVTGELTDASSTWTKKMKVLKVE